MKKYSIKQISFYGFLILFFIFVISGITIQFLASKHENLHYKYYVLEKSLLNMLEYKYFTERLLTTQNLTQECLLWNESRDKFKKTFDQLHQENLHIKRELYEFYHVIKNESDKINEKLQTPLFKEKNVMEKSILRRLGEGLNANENSDYYLALTDLKNSLDYLKQYEEFLLDEIKILSNQKRETIERQLHQIKLFWISSFVIILFLGALVVYFVLKLISKTEKKLLKTQSKLVKTNHTLTIQQNELESIINNIPSMIFVKEVDTLRFVNFNKAGEKLLGVKAKELIGKSDYDLFPKEQAEFFAQKDKEVIRTGKMLDIKEESIKTINGDKILHTKKVIIKDKENKPLFLLGISDDITEKKEQEKIIEGQSRNAAMGEMIGNIAHQWRQPLSVISTGATGMLMQKQFGQLDDEQFEKTCKLINENAQYLSKTIDDFRNFIKNDRKLVEFNLKEQMESFLNLVKPSLKRHNITLILNLDASIKMEGYPNELTQCFMNIFNNAKDALKDSPHHEKLIIIETFQEDENIVIHFQDNAGGIPQEVLSRIFEPYFTTKHQNNGTGLGLSMTYNLITEGMNGNITAQNVNFNHEGDFYYGANFIITLPKSTRD